MGVHVATAVESGEEQSKAKERSRGDREDVGPVSENFGGLVGKMGQQNDQQCRVSAPFRHRRCCSVMATVAGLETCGLGNPATWRACGRYPREPLVGGGPLKPILLEGLESSIISSGDRPGQVSDGPREGSQAAIWTVVRDGTGNGRRNRPTTGAIVVATGILKAAWLCSLLKTG